MGLERKRGKLMALNRYIIGLDREVFAKRYGDVGWLDGVTYVITLDDDTKISAHAALELISIMAHPANKPIYDANSRRTVSGYSILQPWPRLARSETATWYQTIFVALDDSPDVFDPRPNLYQDLFAEGSYYGKGIYNVRALAEAVDAQMRPNWILSHDLLEGCFARSAIASDVAITEPSCANYRIEAHRRHRWIRGDWQLVPWAIARYVGRADGRYDLNRLSALSRWKILDNIRRSLIAPAMLAACLVAWTIAPYRWWITVEVLALLVVEKLVWSINDVVPKEDRRGIRAASPTRQFALFWLQTASRIAFLLHDSYIAVSAISVALWRMCVSRRRLLDWTPFHQLNYKQKSSLVSWIVEMRGSLIATCVLVAAVVIYRPQVLRYAFPILLLWILAPFLGAISSLAVHRQGSPTPGDVGQLAH